MKIRVNHLDTNYAKLRFYPAVGLFHHQFLKPVEGDEYRSVLMKGLELLLEHGAQKIGVMMALNQLGQIKFQII